MMGRQPYDQDRADSVHGAPSFIGIANTVPKNRRYDKRHQQKPGDEPAYNCRAGEAEMVQAGYIVWAANDRWHSIKKRVNQQESRSRARQQLVKAHRYVHSETL